MSKTIRQYEDLELADLDVVMGGADRQLFPPPNPMGISHDAILAGRNAYAAEAATQGGAAGVYLGFGTNVMGNGPSSVMTLGSDGVHYYSSTATGIGNAASVGVVGGVWGATSPNGSAYWTGPGAAGSVGLKEGGAVALELGVNGSGASAGLSLGAGGSPSGVAASVSSTFGTEVHSFGETPQASAAGAQPAQAEVHDISMLPPGAFADRAGTTDPASHPDAGVAGGAGDHGADAGAAGGAGDHGADVGANGAGDHGGDVGGNGAGDHGGDVGANGAGDHGGDVGASSAGDHGGDVGASSASDHGGDLAGSDANGSDHSGDAGAGYGQDSNFGNDFGGGDYGGGDYGGGDFGGGDFGGGDFG